MKKLFVFLLSFIALTSTPMLAASNESSAINANAQTKASKIESRLYEIQKIDKKSLSPSEKKALKAELREMKKSLSDPGVGIYISGTALLIIIIVLILFL